MSKTILTKVDGFTPLIDDIVRNYGITVAAVFGRMWRYCQMVDGVCKASQETIANDLGLTRKTVNQHIALLLETGYLKDLTPDTLNRPHIYADTGQAAFRASITAGTGLEIRKRGVTKLHTSAPETTENGAGVTNLPTSVTELHTRCEKELHLGVTNLPSKIDSLRDSSRKKIRNNADSSDSISENLEKFTPSEAWARIDQQLRAEMKPTIYTYYISGIKPLGWHDHQLAVQVPNPENVEWIRSRLGQRVNLLLTGIVKVPVRVEFVP